MQRIHLQPVGHCRAQPDGEEGMLFGGDARQSGEELSHMVLSVPFGQTVEVLLNRVMVAYLFRVNQLLNLRLGITLFADVLTSGANHDTVQRLLSEHPVLGLFCRKGGKLYLSAQHIATKQVILVQKLLCLQSHHLRSSQCLAFQSVIVCHWLFYY